MYIQKLFSRAGLLALAVAMIFTSCGPDINELVIPPLENYKIGIPLINGNSGVGFRDLLSEEDLEDLQTDPVTGDLYFTFEDSFDIASTNDLVQAFGSASEDDFFSIDFPDPIPTEIPFLTPISVGFSADVSGGCEGANYCIPLGNDIQDDVTISYLRFERGGLQVDYRATPGDKVVLSISGIESDQGTSITVSETVTSFSTSTITLPLTNVALSLMGNTPTLSISITDADGDPTGFISGVQLTPTNTADRVKLLFGSQQTASLDIPMEEIDTDYLSDVFPEDAQINFKSPTVQFRFNNPIGAGISIDLSENGGIYGENKSGVRAPLNFNSDSTDAIEGTSCSQLINVNPATSFDEVEVTNVFACETADLLNIRPVKIAYAGEASYNLQSGDEVLFSKGAEVKAYFAARIPLYLGFTDMAFESGSTVDFDLTSEIQSINSAILRSEVTNGLPIEGTLKLTTKTSENGTVTSEIFINGGNDNNKLILAAETSADGIVTGPSTNYLETDLTEDQVRAILNAGYVDISFELAADADPSTATPEPVQITADQKMTIEMGILLEGTIDIDF
ncbi:hypothetical protein [Flammeovirga sp. SJP92]|uniref:hypothetical protein n=1 Tax=Flammeovirga sp. SJP92 TaxID=1775430 RepID=UPI000787CD72|nr:hypothetical protein [Flammeovirga sp. SJP92]KXX72061.1 hypothetical protein AVL50_02765 [Flammeovirga sp. SJP92]